MLQQSFVHVPGIGPRTERRLWSLGIDSWERVLEGEHPELGRKILDDVIRTVGPIAKVESQARMEGRSMTLVLTPDKKAQEAIKKAEAEAAKEAAAAAKAAEEAAAAAEPATAEPAEPVADAAPPETSGDQ